MKKLSIAATEGYLKEAANFTTVAQFDSAAASMMDELGPHGNDPTIAMAGNNAFKAMGRLRDNFVNKQKAVVNFNTSFAKAKALKLEDTTSGMQELYNSMMTTFEASKQYFNSTEYAKYQKGIEELGDDIKTKSMFNYLDDLALGETDEKGNLIPSPGMQSAIVGFKNLYEMNKVGVISNKDAMKEAFKISKDINAGNVGAIMNFGTKDMRLMDRELKDFNYKELDADYQAALTSDFSALQFNEKEVTPENISYVRGTIGENITNLFNTGFIELPKKKNGKPYANSISGFENFILDELKANPNKPIYEILEDRVDTWGYGLKPGDPDTPTARNQRLHFSKMVDLYMKTGSIMGEVDKARNNDNIDSSISSYTNRLVNLAIDEQQPTPPKGQSNILDLVKTIAEKQRPKSIPSTQPIVPARSIPSLSTPPADKEAERVADIRVSVPSQAPDQDDMSYLNSIDSKQLKNIGIWSDKNVTRKLKSSAKKELQSSIKELQGMRGDIDSAMVAKELPKLRRLLKEFNNAGINKISKGMLEYMYALNASQYEGVDDFLASLSDGKIGVE
jgi:hypothetical protein